MKITHIEIDNLIGIKRADIRVDRPVLVVHGQNGAGKSSLQECIRLALLAHSPRVDLKKDYGKLVHEGAKAGMVALNTSEGAISVHITAEGKVTDSAKGRDSQAFIEYVLDPTFFARDDSASRRKMLYRLLGLDLSPDGIQTRLLAKDCDAQKVVAMAPILRAGFESAQKHAASKATESKGAFRAVTNETWGSSKGATWRAPTPEFSGEQAAELHGIDQSIVDTEAELADANKRLGEAQYAKQMTDAHITKVEQLREIAAGLGEHTNRTEKVEKELAEYETKLQQAREKAGIAPKAKPKALPCPECGAVLCMDVSGKLAPYPVLPTDPAYDPDVAASIPRLEDAVRSTSLVLARHSANKVNAESAKTNLGMLEANPPAKGDDPAIIRETVETLKADIATMRKRQAELRDAQRKLDEADAKTKQARAHHADVLAWDAIAKALSPDGIPSEILGEALGPFNRRLKISCTDARWPVVAIDTDMHITYGGRAYALLSESERWRTDAVIAEAVSSLSGLRFLVLDRLDVLDEPGRIDALYWLDTLALEEDIDTAIALGTMDVLPVDLPTIQCVRVEAGEIAGEKQREAA